MTDRATTIDEHDQLAYDLLAVLEEFIDEIGERGCTGHFGSVVDGRYRLKGKNLVQKPERFIEDHLVFPIFDRALGYTLRPQPKQYAPRWPRGGGIPDFCITSIPISIAMQNDIRVFGEVKPPKEIEKARDDMREYLDKDLDVHAIAFLSDGFDWEMWVRPRNHSVEELDNPHAEASLRNSLKTVRTRNMTMESYQSHTVRNQIDVEGFSKFKFGSVLDLIQAEFDSELELANE